MTNDPNTPNGAADLLAVLTLHADMREASGKPNLAAELREARTAVAALIARNAELEAERDALKQRCRQVCQTLVNAAGADGPFSAEDAAAKLIQQHYALIAERDALRELVNSPELHDFARGAVLEAAHQVERWGSEHDAGKTPADWFWLVGYLAGKALHAQTSGNTEKALHHTISTAGALANWHRAINGANDMRPGIIPPTDAARTAAGEVGNG